MTSLEGRILRRRRAIDAPDGARSELWLWRELAARLDSSGTWDTDPSLVFDELARASAGGRADYSGLSHERLDAEPDLYWPCPATDGDPHPGTPRLFLDDFPTADGRARFIAVDDHGPADDVRPDAPVHLVTGRVLQHYQSGAQTRRVDALVSASPAAFVEIHPVLADLHGIAAGDLVSLTSSRGVVTAPARLTESVRPDTVFMPFHWAGDESVNRVTNDAVDPVSGMPEFKVCAVTVARADLSSTPEPSALRTATEVLA